MTQMFVCMCVCVCGGGGGWRVCFYMWGGGRMLRKKIFLKFDTHMSLNHGGTGNNKLTKKFKSNLYNYMRAQQTQSFAIIPCIRQHSRFRHFMWGGLDNLDL